MKYAYYPGCSLESGSAAYDVSVRAVAKVLGMELEELDDWNCCGATEYFSQDELVATSVIARNLAICRPDQKQLVAPCAACFLNLKKTDHLMAEHADVRKNVNQALAAGGLHYDPGRVVIRHLLDLIYTDIGEAALREKAGQAAQGSACRALLRLPGGAAAGRLRQHRVPDEDGRDVHLAGCGSGGLSGQGPLLWRPHDADQRGRGVRVDSPPAGQRRGIRSRLDPVHVSDVPVESGRVPGSSQCSFQQELPGADHLLHAVAWAWRWASVLKRWELARKSWPRGR